MKKSLICTRWHFFSENESIENQTEKMWLDVQVGRRINIILTSEDNQYISGFTLQGGK